MEGAVKPLDYNSSLPRKFLSSAWRFTVQHSSVIHGCPCTSGAWLRAGWGSCHSALISPGHQACQGHQWSQSGTCISPSCHWQAQWLVRRLRFGNIDIDIDEVWVTMSLKFNVFFSTFHMDFFPRFP